MDQLSFFLAATVRMAIPLLIAALGLVVSERAGLMNIGVEVPLKGDCDSRMDVWRLERA